MSSAAAISSVVDESARDEPAPFDEDDPFDLPPPLPPLSPHRDEDEMNQNGDADGDQPDEGEGGKKESNAKRKVKRSPRPKLDEIRLCSDRGLPALTHLCDGVKFKGKGHEASDLKLLLQRYEYWAHRLFPKFPFADVVDQVEKLGGKKLVQNCIKRVRRGEHDTIDDEEKSDTEHDAQESVVSRDDGTQSQVPATPVSNNVQPFGAQVEPRNGMVILTPEQQERMRLNRERALAKRRAAQENQTAHGNIQINDQTNVIEEPSPSNEVVETAKDADSRAGNVGVENDSSAQANDIEMFDNQVDVTVDVSLPDDRSLESADGAGMGCENKNVREEDIEMENAETTTNLENSGDIAKNRENFPTAQDTNVSKGIKENDLSISVNEGDADSETTFHEDETTSASRVEDIQREGAHETPETRPSEQGPAENGLDGDQNTEMEPES